MELTNMEFIMPPTGDDDGEIFNFAKLEDLQLQFTGIE